MLGYFVYWALFATLYSSEGESTAGDAHSVKITSSPSSQWARLGASVNLYCTASGHPTPTYMWRKKGSQPLPSKVKGQYSNHLVIPDIEPEDAGEYYCIARNHFSESHSKKAWLDILDSPDPSTAHQDGTNGPSNLPTLSPELPSDVVFGALFNSADDGSKAFPHIVAVVVPVISVLVCLSVTVVIVVVLVIRRRKRRRYEVNPGKRFHIGLPHVFVHSPQHDSRRLPRRWRVDKEEDDSWVDPEEVDLSFRK